MAIIRKPLRPHPSLKAADREKRAAFLQDHEHFRQQIAHQSKECASSLALLINAIQQGNPEIVEELRCCSLNAERRENVDQLQASLRKINDEIYEAKLQADDE
ncbi:hypothetical protein RvY_16701 [Ramazzottius varieornatus]|uniref:Uncharacterized protein n=1 Tax=Ramazzottius varieornatus TaxID=947166 RepID=A0A1D1VZG9_RAMVA|nr:hypothetical protein RvY_16701 [Ramazzottius varieornatus]